MHEPMPMTLNDALIVRGVTNWQILLFGLTGWPYPLPGSNYRAVDMHSVESPDTGRNTGRKFQHSPGVAACHRRRWRQQSAFSRSQNAGSGLTLSLNAPPYFSSLLIGLVGVYMGVWLHGHNVITQSFRLACYLQPRMILKISYFR